MRLLTLRKLSRCTALLAFLGVLCFVIMQTLQYYGIVSTYRLESHQPSAVTEPSVAAIGEKSPERVAIGAPVAVDKNETSPERVARQDSIPGPLYSDKVINPHPFNFTLINEEACGQNATEEGKPVFLLILVKCRPGETFARAQIRDTWGGVTSVDGRRVLTMFLVGLAPNSTQNDVVRAESHRYRDIVQENFTDHYRNLTFKTMMGWRWAARYCPQARYVASADADVLLNLGIMVRRLVDKPRHKFAEGNAITHARPFRDKRRPKWTTSKKVYPEATYAPYFSGVCYVFSADVAAAVFSEGVHVRFLPWDDAFVGLVLKRIGVKLQNVDSYSRFRQEQDIEKAIASGPAVIVGKSDIIHTGWRNDDSAVRIKQIWRKVNLGNDTGQQTQGHIP